MSVGQAERSHDLRERILDATLQVIRERGMAGTRTSAIARVAGCAEGSIYRYFSGKPELLHEAVRTRLPELGDLLPPTLEAQAGSATVAEHLLAAARVATAFYLDVAFLLAGVAGDADLSWRAELGSEQAAAALASYLRVEQALGRVRDDADPELSARLLLSTCLGESICCTVGGGDAHDRMLRRLVELVARDLEPR